MAQGPAVLSVINPVNTLAEPRDRPDYTRARMTERLSAPDADAEGRVAIAERIGRLATPGEGVDTLPWLGSDATPSVSYNAPVFISGLLVRSPEACAARSRLVWRPRHTIGPD
jgi:hypothetical protein